MNGLLTSAAFLSLFGVAAVALACSLLAQAQGEFQSRLRDQALRRTRAVLVGALCASAAAATVSGYEAAGRPDAVSPISAAHAAPSAPNPALRLQLSPALGLGPHLREQQHVADRR